MYSANDEEFEQIVVSIDFLFIDTISFKVIERLSYFEIRNEFHRVRSRDIRLKTDDGTNFPSLIGNRIDDNSGR